MLMDVVRARMQLAADFTFRDAAFEFSRAKAPQEAIWDRLFFTGFAYRVFEGEAIELDYA
jgi:hypothetical protein